MAVRLFSTSAACIALVDDRRAWLIAALGVGMMEIPVADSFAAHAIADPGGLLVVEDAARDPRFAGSALVTTTPGVRFYAGAAVVVKGQPVGALQVFSTEPRDAPPLADLDQLRELALLAGTLLELKRDARVREATEADLIREEWRHALTLEAGKVGSFMWDLRTDEIALNDILRRMYGFAATEALTGARLLAVVNEADRPALDEALRATFEDGVDFHAEFRISATDRWVVARGRVYQRDAAGQPITMMGVNIDVTDTRAATEHTRILLRELNHRVKNTLAVIQSLARQTLRQNPDPGRFIDSFSGRLQALSEAHSLLSNRDWSGIGLVEQVEARVRHFASDGADQLELAGEDVAMPPDHALALGLILHELASNASQYGALSVPEGRVRIEWAVHDGARPELELVWKERGGPGVAPPERRGFGTRLIERGLDKIIDSSVDLRFPPNGVEARIRMPLN